MMPHMMSEAQEVCPSSEFAIRLLLALHSRGVRDVIVSPGSRSQALALAAAELEATGHIRLHVRIDERSAAFLALGLSKATGRPTPVIVTSGSAVGNLLPAVMEAHRSLQPLVILSADRPADVRGRGASQTTAQVGLFSRFTRFACDVSTPNLNTLTCCEYSWVPPTNLPLSQTETSLLNHDANGSTHSFSSLQSLADHLAWSLASFGPSHLNLQFREPLSGSHTPINELLQPSTAHTHEHEHEHEHEHWENTRNDAMGTGGADVSELRANTNNISGGAAALNMSTHTEGASIGHAPTVTHGTSTARNTASAVASNVGPAANAMSAIGNNAPHASQHNTTLNALPTVVAHSNTTTNAENATVSVAGLGAVNIAAPLGVMHTTTCGTSAGVGSTDVDVMGAISTAAMIAAHEESAHLCALSSASGEMSSSANTGDAAKNNDGSHVKRPLPPAHTHCKCPMEATPFLPAHTHCTHLGGTAQLHPAHTLVVAGFTAEHYARPGTLPANASTPAATLPSDVDVLAELTSGWRAYHTLGANYRELVNAGLNHITDLVIVGMPNLSREVAAMIARPDLHVYTLTHLGEETTLPASAIPISYVSWVQDAANTRVKEGESPRLENQLTPSVSPANVNITREALIIQLFNYCTQHQAPVYLAASHLVRLADSLIGPAMIPVYSHRGLAGIDGTISLAIGCALGTIWPHSCPTQLHSNTTAMQSGAVQSQADNPHLEPDTTEPQLAATQHIPAAAKHIIALGQPLPSSGQPLPTATQPRSATMQSAPAISQPIPTSAQQEPASPEATLSSPQPILSAANPEQPTTHHSVQDSTLDVSSPELTSAELNEPLRLLIGDLAFLHDASSLARPEGEELPPLQIIVANDHGGHIFSTLEVAQADPAAYRRVVATPMHADLSAICRAYGWPHITVATPAELERALATKRPMVIEATF